MQLVTIFQDYGQVLRRWGKDNAPTVFSNHVARVILPGLADTDLLENVSKLIGEQPVTGRTVSHGPGGTSTSETERRERLAPLDQIRTLPSGQAVLIHANTPPAKVTLRPYYEQPQWKTLGGWLSSQAKPAASGQRV